MSTDQTTIDVDFDPSEVAAAIVGDDRPARDRDADSTPTDGADPGTYAALVMRAARPARDIRLALDGLDATDLGPLRAALAAYERDVSALEAIAREAEGAAEEITRHLAREREAVAAVAAGVNVKPPRPLDPEALRFASDVPLARARAAFAEVTRSARAVESAYDALRPALFEAAIARVEAAGLQYLEALDHLRDGEAAQTTALASLAALHRQEAAEHPDVKVRAIRESIARAWHHGLSSRRPYGTTPDSEVMHTFGSLRGRAITGDYLDAVKAGPGPLPEVFDMGPNYRAVRGGSDVPPGLTM